MTKHDMLTFCLDQVSVRPPLQDNNNNNIADTYASPQVQISGALPQWEQWQNDPLWNIDFLGLDFSDQWQQF
jgi:hypothetical protein